MTTTPEEKCTCLHTFELRGERQCKKHPKSERGVEEAIKKHGLEIQEFALNVVNLGEMQVKDLLVLLTKITDTALHHQLQKARVEVLKEIETIAVKTKCDYASAINRYMNNNEISEESITPPKNISSNETMV